MANGNGNVTNRNMVVAVISAVLASAGSPFILVKLGVNPYRQDPATGTEIRWMDNRVDALEATAKDHLANHPDRTLMFDRRITVVETQQRVIIANQERILSKLDQR